MGRNVGAILVEGLFLAAGGWHGARKVAGLPGVCPPTGCLAVLSRLHQLAMGPSGRVLGWDGGAVACHPGEEFSGGAVLSLIRPFVEGRTTRGVCMLGARRWLAQLRFLDGVPPVTGAILECTVGCCLARPVPDLKPCAGWRGSRCKARWRLCSAAAQPRRARGLARQCRHNSGVGLPAAACRAGVSTPPLLECETMHTTSHPSSHC